VPLTSTNGLVALMWICSHTDLTLPQRMPRSGLGTQSCERQRASFAIEFAQSRRFREVGVMPHFNSIHRWHCLGGVA